MLRYWIECVSSLFFRCYSIVNVYFALPGHVKVHGSVKLSPEVASTVATCGKANGNTGETSSAWTTLLQSDGWMTLKVWFR